MLVLASQSPRRRALLQQMGVEFATCSPNIDETPCLDESALQYVKRMAMEKAYAVQPQCKGAAILAADTVVVHRKSVLTKPKNKTHAMEMWHTLSNSEHQVITALCLLNCDNLHSMTSETIVQFGTITEQQMHAYWDTEEPKDKAGAYAIQGFASAWVKQITGSYSNVVGLPLFETNLLLCRIEKNWL